MSNTNASEMLLDLFRKMMKSNFNDHHALKVKDIYGTWGMTYAFYVGPFLCIIPILVFLLMLLVFKRKNLMGVTQKFILSIMIMNVCFTTTSAVRDGLLRIFQMHYGFLEFHVCTQVILSLRVQVFLNTTATWLNALMLLHQVLLVGFPLKVKFHNLSLYFYVFFVFHLAFVFTTALVLTAPNFKPIRLFQEYRAGYTVKLIEGCNAYSSAFLDGFIASNYFDIFLYVIIIYCKVFPLTLHLITIISLTVLLSKHIRTLSVLTHNVSVERIKYVALMKVNIALGLSFIAQELPVLVLLFYQCAHIDVSQEEVDIYSHFNGIASTIMSLSYCIGKPLDLLIYSSLSKQFKDEIKQILICTPELCRIFSRKSHRKSDGARNQKKV